MQKVALVGIARRSDERQFRKAIKGPGERSEILYRTGIAKLKNSSDAIGASRLLLSKFGKT